MTAHCPHPYHCPHINADGSVCNSHPQPSKTKATPEGIRLYCYLGHSWVHKEPPK
jgi:hypothetical protein